MEQKINAKTGAYEPTFTDALKKFGIIGDNYSPSIAIVKVKSKTMPDAAPVSKKKEVNPNDIKNIYVNKAKGTVVVIFANGDKQVAKCQKGDHFDEGVGIALCLAHNIYGNYSGWIKKMKTTSVYHDITDEYKQKKQAKKSDK